MPTGNHCYHWNSFLLLGKEMLFVNQDPNRRGKQEVNRKEKAGSKPEEVFSLFQAFTFSVSLQNLVVDEPEVVLKIH